MASASEILDENSARNQMTKKLTTREVLAATEATKQNSNLASQLAKTGKSNKKPQKVVIVQSSSKSADPEPIDKETPQDSDQIPAEIGSQADHDNSFPLVGHDLLESTLE